MTRREPRHVLSVRLTPDGQSNQLQLLDHLGQSVGVEADGAPKVHEQMRL